VAAGDLNGDGFPDIITATGPGVISEIKVLSGKDSSFILDFPVSFTFNPLWTGGVWVAAGDFNGDGYDDIIVGADAGGASEIKVFNGKDSVPIFDFFAFPGFTGGVRVGAADFNNDGFADIVAAMGPGGSLVNLFNGKDSSTLLSFFTGLSGGLYVAGVPNGAAQANILIGAGANSSLVELVSGADGSLLQSFPLFGSPSPGGVPVASVDMNRDGRGDFLGVTGAGALSLLRAVDAATLDGLDSLFAYDPAFLGGAFVGAGA